jgi:hypothetical protein
MTGISADYATLMRQASATACEYLLHGIEDIDRLLGNGYAGKHPELLVAYMQTAAGDLMAATIAKEIGGGIEAVAVAIEAGQRE